MSLLESKLFLKTRLFVRVQWKCVDSCLIRYLERILSGGGPSKKQGSAVCSFQQSMAWGRRINGEISADFPSDEVPILLDLETPPINSIDGKHRVW